jgi:hypothetical protein
MGQNDSDVHTVNTFGGTMRRLVGLLAFTLFGLAPIASGAEEITWRATSVQGPRTPAVNTRLGVAMFSSNEAATYERKISAAAPPQDGKLAVHVESVYRFADGSTLVMRSRESINLTPQGTHGRDEWAGDGQIVSGTGRFAGATGTFTFRAAMGLDRQAEGMLGDSFLSGQGRYVLQPTK